MLEHEPLLLGLLLHRAHDSPQLDADLREVLDGALHAHLHPAAAAPVDPRRRRAAAQTSDAELGNEPEVVADTLQQSMHR